MKKILTLALSAAALFSFASCQKTEVVNDEANVTIKVGMVETKAISDGTTANNLLYEVYYKGADGQLTQILKSSKLLENKSTSLSFKLMRGSSYVVLFWAEPEKYSPYTTTNLQAVEMNYSQSQEGNNEYRDAFYGSLEFTVADNDDDNTAEKNPEMVCTLSRPFAQINFVANDYDNKLMVDGQEVATMTLTKTEVTFYNLATTFNVLTGKAAEANTDAGNFPTTFTATGGVDYDGEDGMDFFDGNNALRWVSMDYILVPNNKQTVSLEAKLTVDLKYNNIEDPVTNQPISVYTNDNVPAAANFRTNIVGDLFTEDGQVQIQINPDYLKDDNVVDVQ